MAADVTDGMTEEWVEQLVDMITGAVLAALEEEGVTAEA